MAETVTGICEGSVARVLTLALAVYRIAMVVYIDWKRCTSFTGEERRFAKEM